MGVDAGRLRSSHHSARMTRRGPAGPAMMDETGSCAMNPVEISTFGELRVAHEGEALTLPSSRKTRALLVYLALIGRPASRQELCALLWDLPDDPRGALRWSLSRLRSVVNVGGTERLTTERDMVALDRTAVEIDLDRLVRLSRDREADRGELAAALTATEGPWLEDCQLPNLYEYSAWLEGQRHEVSELRAAVAGQFERASPSSSTPGDRWANRWGGPAPSPPPANGARAWGPGQAATAVAPDPPADTTPPAQRIRFVRTRDEVSIAWASAGDPARPPLVKPFHWLSDLDSEWTGPVWSPLLHQLTTDRHLVRYDARGCGLSDREPADISLEACVADLEAVVDAAGIERFPLLGMSHGAAIAIAYAARHPERVSHLVLFGGFARGWRLTESIQEKALREAMLLIARTTWNSDNPAFRYFYTQSMMPEADRDAMGWLGEFQSEATSAESAMRFIDVFSRIDLTGLLPRISCPTLVMHSRGDRRIPIARGRELAEQIPGARFASLETRNHTLLGSEPAAREFLRLVAGFLEG